MCTLVIRAVPIVLGLALFTSTAAHAESSNTFSRTMNVAPKGEVEVSTVGGTVEVTGWDKPQVLVNANYDDDVERIDVSNEHGRTVIKVVVAQRSHQSDVELKIRVPHGSELEVTAVSADIRVKDILGEQRLKTVSGNISADVAQSDVETKTVSGNTILRGMDKAVSVRVTTISGDIRYDRGGGDLEATTVSGDLSAALRSANDIRVRTTSGDITLSGNLSDNGSIEGESISGELTVHMAAEEGFRYEVSSFSGDIENCFNEEPQRVSKYGPGTRLSGSRREGKGEVRLKTLSGTVNLCDR